jgi:heterodisulfide reductase subunit B
MKITYYPGCSLEGTSVDYAASIAAIAALLNVELMELFDWNCCEASSAHSLNRSRLTLPARNWRWPAAGRDVVAPCAMLQPQVAENCRVGREELGVYRRDQDMDLLTI